MRPMRTLPRALVLTIFVSQVLSCTREVELNASFDFAMPDQIKRALTMITDVRANAELVPRGGTPAAPIALERGDDGVSFSGFIPAEPGDYTLELSFNGIYAPSTHRVFLGRLVSDAFTVSAGNTVSASYSSPLD